MSQTNYDEANIISMNQLEFMRFKPNFSIGSRDITGQIHAVNEVFSNSRDEMAFVENGLIQVWMFINKKKNTYQICVVDNGRGIPLSKLKSCVTVPHTSGKYNAESYSGLVSGAFGYGLKAVYASSKRLRAISYRQRGTGFGGYGSITTNKLEIVEDTIDRNNHPAQNGVLVIYEPDPEIFIDMNKFIEDGGNAIIEMLQQSHVFNPHVTFIFSIIESFIDEKFWNSDILTALDIFTKFTAKSIVCYDSIDWKDPLKYITQLWDLNSPINWISDNIEQKIMTQEDILGYSIKLYLPRKLGQIGILALINGVAINKQDASHITGILQVLKSLFSEFIPDKDIKEFFLTKYRLPICITADIKYKMAEHFGTTKNDFKDNKFLKLFMTALLHDIKTNYYSSITACWNYISSHLEDEYAKFINKPIKIESSKNLLLGLNFSRKFMDCEKHNLDSELFLVEGDSASNVKQVRDPRYQAVYFMRGKVLNSVIDMANRKLSVSKLTKDKIWQDIIRIIGLNPLKDDQDLSALNFGKIIVCTDADPDGDHLNSLLIGNFYILNPNIVENGFMYIAKPPLYSMYRDNKNKKVFMYNHAALIDYRILMYEKVYDIKIKDVLSENTKHLNREEFRSFCYVISDIGERMRILSETLNIPDFILECLIHILPMLQTSINTKALQEFLPFDRINYNEHSNLLIISVGMNDYAVSLNGFVDIINSEIYPLLQNVGWNDFKILVSTKLSNLMKDEEVSFTKMNGLFNKINDLYKTVRYKGLGKMSNEDLHNTCVNPNTRALFHIRSIGDVERIYALLGTDASERKNMLIDGISI